MIRFETHEGLNMQKRCFWGKYLSCVMQKNPGPPSKGMKFSWSPLDIGQIFLSPPGKRKKLPPSKKKSPGCTTLIPYPRYACLYIDQISVHDYFTISLFSSLQVKTVGGFNQTNHFGLSIDGLFCPASSLIPGLVYLVGVTMLLSPMPAPYRLPIMPLFWGEPSATA